MDNFRVFPPDQKIQGKNHQQTTQEHFQNPDRHILKNIDPQGNSRQGRHGQWHNVLETQMGPELHQEDEC